MPLFLAILLVILPILASTEPLDFAAFGAKLVGYRNVTAIGIIMAEEADFLKMGTQELLDQCNKIVGQFKLTSEEGEQIKKDGRQNSQLMFNSTDEVLPYLKVNAPSTHAVVLKRIEIVKKSIENEDRATKGFVTTIGESILKMIVFFSQSNARLMNNAEYAKFKENKKKLETEIRADLTQKYGKLSLPSKNSLDKKFCIKPLLRIGGINDIADAVAGFTRSL